MQAPIADFVHPIFRHVLALRDRLDAGEALQWNHERAAIKTMLAELAPPGNQSVDAAESGFDLSEHATPQTQQQLTRSAIAYALTWWLDEFLSQHSAWGERWREQRLEAEIYGDCPTSRKFWEEARYAETRGDRDALEVIYWCVALGHCGAWPGTPEMLQAWQTRVRAVLDRTTPTCTMPASLMPSSRELEMSNDAPTRRMAFSLLLGAALVLPTAAMILWRW